MSLTHQAAYTLVKAAIDSKSIQLGGPNAAGSPEEAGRRDAAYLTALLQALISQPEAR